MSLISVSDLTFGYEGSFDTIFEHVNLQLDTDWRLGLIGRNGRGKTTLLRLLMGELEYRGTISAPVEFAYFPYAVKDDSLTAETVVRSICPQVQLWELQRELSLLEVDGGVLERPFCTLSGGQRTKVLLAALFQGENRFLLIDEPTNHLDLEGRRAVSRYLRGKKGYILVSHDRAFLDGCVDHVLSINKANIEVQKGNFSSWWENKQRRDEFELAQNEKLKKEVKRLEQTAREKTQWADRAEGRKIGFDPKKTEKSMGRRAYEGAKSKKQMKRAKAIRERREAAVEETAALLKNLDVASDLKLWPLRHRAGTLVTLENVTARYGDVTACHGVSLVVKQGERVALQGINGCGKSTVLKLICGKPIDFTGSVTKASGLVISYVSQDTSGLRGSLSEYARQYGIDESLFKTILRKLGFVRDQFEKDISRFSGGQKKKVLLARSLCEKAHLYVWDEPLNFMDVLSRMQIEELLLEYRPTLLFVEHDKQFCDNIATRTVLL